MSRYNVKSTQFHADRLIAALYHKDVLAEWCVRNGFHLDVKNNGHH